MRAQKSSTLDWRSAVKRLSEAKGDNENSTARQQGAAGNRQSGEGCGKMRKCSAANGRIVGAPKPLWLAGRGLDAPADSSSAQPESHLHSPAENARQQPTQKPHDQRSDREQALAESVSSTSAASASPQHWPSPSPHPILTLSIFSLSSPSTSTLLAPFDCTAELVHRHCT